MERVFIDFETRSNLSIKKVGAMKYLHTPSSDIICLSYCINPPPYGSGEVKLWLPHSKPPFDPGGIVVYAHNALFEYRVWNILGKKYNFPQLPLENMVDTMALCGRYTFYQDLASAAKVLGVPVQKDPRGQRLMNKITQPPFKYTREELHAFYSYCMTDTKTMIEIVKALPADHLNEEEQKIWANTQRINLRGLPIDFNAVKRIWAVMNYHKDREVKKIPKLTDGKLSNVTQTVALAQWAGMPDCKKETVEKTIEALELVGEPSPVLDVLKIRRDLGRSSVAKYKKLIDQCFNNRVYDNLRYYAASTGRYGGMSFQAHNLPRTKVDDIEGTLEKFYDTSILQEDVMYASMALIRSVIQAPEGKKLSISDYKSIENRMISWVAGEDRIIKLFYKGFDEYKDFATDLYKVKYDDVDGDMRFFSKVVILGAGYNLGAGGLMKYAEGYGLDITPRQAEIAIKTYRDTHPKIRQMWYKLKDCAVSAILYPGEVYSTNSCTFRVVNDRTRRPWLVLTLPSGRNLFYCEPETKEDSFGMIPTHMGINSYNKKWQRLKLIPGRITENVVQALARDIMAYGKLLLEDYGFQTILSVHDEVINEVDEDFDDLDKIHTLMCTNPPWATGLPLAAEGVFSKRYYKI